MEIRIHRKGTFIVPLRQDQQHPIERGVFGERKILIRLSRQRTAIWELLFFGCGLRLWRERFGLLGDLRKAGGFTNGDVGKNFAIKINACSL